MSYYVVRNKYAIPGFVFKAVASWVVVFGGVTIFLLIDWFGSATTHFELVDSLPPPVRTLLGVCGAYGALGAFCLWMAMWVYWIAFDRSRIPARIGWFLVLLFGLAWGALIYAVAVWGRDITKVDGPQPIRGA